jgi:alpha-D-ribose 1-methylphosphonate 5-triphosphate synthase subunit PhnG
MPTQATIQSADRETGNAVRARVMGILAKASPEELAAAAAAHWPGMAGREPKPAEAGLVMLRGRIGGDGAAFNLGEATVARAVIDLPTGERGVGHCLGRDTGKARLVALFDALWQRAADRPLVESAVIAPVERRLAAEASRVAERTAATRVDFFTLVRGDD